MSSEMLEKLLKISRELAETRELAPLLEFAMDIALDFVGAEFGYLVLVKPDNQLEFRVKRNNAGYSLTDEQIEISYTILADAISKRNPLLSGNALIDPLYNDSESVQAYKIRSVMCVPLISRDQVIGSLYVENRTEEDIFSQDDLKALQFFASQAAIAIENAMLNDELESRVEERTAQLQKEIEDRQRAEAELVEVALERERVKMLSVFLQDTAHQFRNPISSAKTALYLLCKTNDLVMADNRHATMANESLDSLEELINEMMLITNLDMGWANLSLEKVSVNSLLHTLMTVVQNRVNQKNLKLTISPTDESVMIYVDHELIHQALMQVVDNAITFTPDSGEICISADLQNTSIRINVQDTGIGIAEEYIPNIFSRFVRIDPSRSQRGFGLGLPIAERIAQIHEGQIDVESKPGKGSSFTLILPLHINQA